MAESDRITALETKVGSLEQRMNKLEISDENRVSSLSGINTELRLLGQKFDTLVGSLEKTEDSRKFNWVQILSIFGILIALASTVWATNYTVEKTIKTQVNNSKTLQISQEDVQTLTEAVIDNMTSKGIR